MMGGEEAEDGQKHERMKMEAGTLMTRSDETSWSHLHSNSREQLVGEETVDRRASFSQFILIIQRD